MPWHHVGRVQLAQLLGVHVDSVTHWAKEGMPVVVKGGHGKENLYDAIDCLAWWRHVKGQQDAFDTARTRAANANAERTEIAVKQARGELLPRDQVMLAGQTTVKGWTSVIRSLPRRMAHAGLIRRDQEPAVTALLSNLLLDILSWNPLESVGVVKRRKAS